MSATIARRQQERDQRELKKTREITHHLWLVSNACQAFIVRPLFCDNEAGGSFRPCRIEGHSVMSYNLSGCFINRVRFTAVEISPT